MATKSLISRLCTLHNRLSHYNTVIQNTNVGTHWYYSYVDISISLQRLIIILHRYHVTNDNKAAKIVDSLLPYGPYRDTPYNN